MTRTFISQLTSMATQALVNAHFICLPATGLSTHLPRHVIAGCRR
jgi:hypothetical protein